MSFWLKSSLTDVLPHGDLWHTILSLPYAKITLEATRHNGEIKRRTENPTV